MLPAANRLVLLRDRVVGHLWGPPELWDWEPADRWEPPKGCMPAHRSALTQDKLDRIRQRISGFKRGVRTRQSQDNHFSKNENEQILVPEKKVKDHFFLAAQRRAYYD